IIHKNSGEFSIPHFNFSAFGRSIYSDPGSIKRCLIGENGMPVNPGECYGSIGKKYIQGIAYRKLFYLPIILLPTTTYNNICILFLLKFHDPAHYLLKTGSFGKIYRLQVHSLSIKMRMSIDEPRKNGFSGGIYDFSSVIFFLKLFGSTYSNEFSVFNGKSF